MKALHLITCVLLGCAAQSADRELVCVEDDDGVDCLKASIKYEYEMLEAQNKGDMDGYEQNRALMIEAHRRGCDFGNEMCCESLEQNAKQ